MTDVAALMEDAPANASPRRAAALVLAAALLVPVTVVVGAFAVGSSCCSDGERMAIFAYSPFVAASLLTCLAGLAAYLGWRGGAHRLGGLAIALAALGTVALWLTWAWARILE